MQVLHCHHLAIRLRHKLVFVLVNNGSSCLLTDSFKVLLPIFRFLFAQGEAHRRVLHSAVRVASLHSCCSSCSRSTWRVGLLLFLNQVASGVLAAHARLHLVLVGHLAGGTAPLALFFVVDASDLFAGLAHVLKPDLARGRLLFLPLLEKRSVMLASFEGHGGLHFGGLALRHHSIMLRGERTDGLTTTLAKRLLLLGCSHLFKEI